MTAKTKKNEVAVEETASVPTTTEIANQFMDDAGIGFEDMTADDIAIPFLVILQSGSPQLKRGEGRIEGAEEGDIFNTVTGVFYKGNEGIYIVPCAYKKAFIEWTPREAGGGFVRQHNDANILNNTTKDDKGRDVLPNGNLIVTTAYHYATLIDTLSGDSTECVISMTSTQLKKSRKWNSVMSGLKLTNLKGEKFTPPMFSHVYKFTTNPESNELGAWSGWKIDIVSQIPTIELYNTAKGFATNVNRGLIKEAVPSQNNVGEEEVF